MSRAVRWLLPAALLALTPKCLLCVLAYTGFASALGFGGREVCGAPEASPDSWRLFLAVFGIGFFLIGIFAGRRSWRDFRRARVARNKTKSKNPKRTNGLDKTYCAKGELATTGRQVNGVKAGGWKFYLRKGSARATGRFVKGKFEGIRKWNCAATGIDRAAGTLAQTGLNPASRWTALPAPDENPDLAYRSPDHCSRRVGGV